MNGSSETEERESSQSSAIADVQGSTHRQGIPGPSETQRSITSGDMVKSVDPPEIQESTERKNMPGPSETQRSIKSGEPTTNTKMESTDEAINQDMPGPSETQRSIKSGDMEESLVPTTKTKMESTDEAINRDIKSGDTRKSVDPPEISESTERKDIPGPSETQRSRNSGDMEESADPPDDSNPTEIPESPDTTIPQELPGPSVIQRSEGTEQQNTEIPDKSNEVDSAESKTVWEIVPWPSYMWQILSWPWDIFIVPCSRIFNPWSSCSYHNDLPALQIWEEEPSEDRCDGNIGASGNSVNTDDGDFVIVKDSDVSAVREGKSFQDNIDTMREGIGSVGWVWNSYRTVGIFSRSSDSDYEWLINELESKPFQSTVTAVHHHYISNNGMMQFMEAVNQCTFGILYHTKNRGRVNITDVTDSLYDEELKYMSERLGKENVIVVIDDLEDTSDTEKNRILNTQFSIKILSKDLFLFSEDEKPKNVGAIQ